MTGKWICITTRLMFSEMKLCHMVFLSTNHGHRGAKTVRWSSVNITLGKATSLASTGRVADAQLQAYPRRSLRGIVTNSNEAITKAPANPHPHAAKKGASLEPKPALHSNLDQTTRDIDISSTLQESNWKASPSKGVNKLGIYTTEWAGIQEKRDREARNPGIDEHGFRKDSLNSLQAAKPTHLAPIEISRQQRIRSDHFVSHRGGSFSQVTNKRPRLPPAIPALFQESYQHDPDNDSIIVRVPSRYKDFRPHPESVTNAQQATFRPLAHMNYAPSTPKYLTRASLRPAPLI